MSRSFRTAWVFVFVGACAPAQSGLETSTDASSSTAHDPNESASSLAQSTDAESPTGGCAGQFVASAPDLLATTPLGIVTHYDVDQDGKADVVGGRGVVVLHSSPEIQQVPSAPDTNNGIPGAFGTGATGLVYSIASTEELWVVPDILDMGASPVVSAASTSWALDVADFDGDGIDDVALLVDMGHGVEVWRGSEGGTFSPGATIMTSLLAAPAFIRLESRTAPALAAAGLSGEVTFYREVDGVLVTFESMTFSLGGLTRLRGIDVANNGVEWLLGDWWRSADGITASGVGLAFPDDRGWDGFAHDLDGDFPNAYAPVDLDGDGDQDLVLVAEGLDDGRHRLDLLCMEANSYQVCGTMELAIEPTDVGVLDAPLRVLLGTDSETWITELMPEC